MSYIPNDQSFEVRDAVEIAASAAHDRQTDARIGSSATVGKKRIAVARHIIGRFLELAPEDMTANEMRELLDSEMPTAFMETP